MDIYWVKNGQKQGPAPEVTLVSLLEGGELTPETLGWHKGCEQWMALKDLPALSSHFSKPSQQPTEKPTLIIEEGGSIRSLEARDPKTGTQVKIISIATPSPWVRFAARFFDSFLYLVLVLAIISFLTPNPSSFFSNESFYLFLWFPFVLYECLLLRFWGTTPGKALLKIQVRSLRPTKPLLALAEGTETEEKHLRPASANPLSSCPTIGQALKRSFQVFCLGMGFYMSLFIPFTLVFSYFTLKNRGITLWDNACHTSPISKPTSGVDWAIYASCFFLLFLLLGMIVQPHEQEIIDILQKQR